MYGIPTQTFLLTSLAADIHTLRYFECFHTHIVDLLDSWHHTKVDFMFDLGLWNTCAVQIS